MNASSTIWKLDGNGHWYHESIVPFHDPNDLGVQLGHLSLDEINKALLKKKIIKDPILIDDISPTYYCNGALVIEPRFNNISINRIIPIIKEAYPENFV